MRFEEWANKFYEENEEQPPDKDQRETLRDQVAGRVMLVLMIREWEFGEKKPRYKNRYMYFNEEYYIEKDDPQNDRIEMLRKHYMKKGQEEEKLREQEKKWLERKKYEDDKAEEKLELITYKLDRVSKTKKEHYEKYIEEKYGGVRIDLFEDVTDEESDFYKLLFSVIGRDGRGKNVYKKLKEGEWWVVSLEDRKKILEGVGKLAQYHKWYFVREIYGEIVEKIINPKGYLLNRALLEFVHVVDMFDYYCNSETISFTIPEYQKVDIEYNGFMESEEASEYSIMYENLRHEIKDIISKLEKRVDESNVKVLHTAKIDEELEMFGRMGLRAIEEEKMKKCSNGGTEV